MNSISGKMSTLIVEKDGSYSCEGTGKCGGTYFDGKNQVIQCFNCDSCPSFQRSGLKIIDERGQQNLGSWFTPE